ncbi:MAG: hypothetical protein HZR80_15550 [Candidatus Heimdallarchaeota archaeon]
MKVESHKCYNTKAIHNVNPSENLGRIIQATEPFLKYLMEIKPEIESEYIQALKKRLNEDVDNKKVNSSFLELEEVVKNLTILKDKKELQDIISQFVCKYWDLPDGTKTKDDRVEIFNLNYTKAYIRISYYRVKSFIDVLGEEKGLELYKQILAKIVDEEVRNADYKRKTQRESGEKSIKYWTETGLGNFTSCFFDDYKVLFRFDKCVIHEALKDFQDPNIAYIASCYRGNVQGAHPGKFWNMRRTQTLHHASFCDELYWYNNVHPDAEQLSLEFTKNLGKE